MNICLVSAFPPSQQALNEYGFHIARELRHVPGLSLTVLGDDLPEHSSELPDYSVIRCWSFNSLQNPWRLLRALREVQPDAVWFNLGFASFGDKPIPAFMGIVLPAMIRANGFDTHVTLHQLMETVDLKDAGVRSPLLYKVGGFIATRVLLSANSVSVLLPAYRNILRAKYKRGAVYVRRHGTLWGEPEYPDLSKRGNPVHRILAFGKWGTYKRLEMMLEAFELLCQQMPNVELLIAGTDHPKAHGYLTSIQNQCSQEKVKFIGYVPEQDIPELFQSSSLVAMPYTSSAGSSGVAHLACAYGVPIVASDIPDCLQLVDEEGIAIEFYRHGDPQSLTEALLSVLENRARQREMALQNHSAALQMSMPEIIRQYVRTFDLQNRIGALRSVARVRKLPRWLPMRSWAARRAIHKASRRTAELTLSDRILDISAAPADTGTNGNHSQDR
ncbi:MAG: glycosyltransferase [Acidobacteriaceae bacterium]|nr:glycosyltransferase [Acidobacteriaceae bacterium]